MKSKHKVPVVKSKRKSEAGFSLIEAMIATVITVVGLLAVEMLIVQSIRVQTFSRDASMANSLARAQIERIRSLPRTDARRANGGSLTGDAATDPANYRNTSNTRFTSRWTVADGPAGTQDVTVAVLSNQSSLMPTIQIRALLP
jgi:Tfp pilus assembly protein PilV